MKDLRGAKFLCDREKIHGRQLAAARHGDDLAVGKRLADLTDGFKPLLFGHEDVGDDEVRRVLLHLTHAFQTVPGLIDFVSGLREKALHQ